MRALMVHHGCNAAFETLAVDMEAGEKAALMNNAYSTLILCLRDQMMNKLILDLANIDIEIEDENQALMLLILLPSSYENFVETLLYERESLTMEDTLATLYSIELKKRTEGTKEETGDGLYVRGGQIIKSHLKRDCPLKKSSEFVRKGKYDQDSDSSDEEGNTYFGEALVLVGNDEMSELVMDSEGYIVKMRMGRIKVIKGCRVMMIEIKKKNCLHTLEAKVVTFGVQKHGDSKQVGFKQLEAKMQRAQENREAEGLQVGANIMVTIVPGQGVEGNVAEKKKVKEYVKTNLGKLLKYNA
uniref:Retrovirus-related Pol polyprotein from transposon TNT 1-94 n=1 Tax=Tanacetum cinerariifolium TaxID=118510 RepID=A0A699HVQ0_TANCI|nr:retrovirus-related Pol polyprotein from transposon TNT 1-94 [Tanacetum cinerariifolium]GEZ83088.1 retrovirus-related Pol polyprotein from transposon TNT 1-94 [Tanacetum cinerariifolium]